MASKFNRPNSSESSTGKSKFAYRPRTAEEMARRAHQSGSNREGFVQQDVQTFTPQDNLNKLRILPPTWDDADHYGMELFVHYNVGEGAFICLLKEKGTACPVCEARMALDRDGDGEAAKALLPRKRVAMWVIDRAEEAKGPKLWFAPWTLDQEIAQQALDEDTGGALPLDHPEKGYDVTFSRDQQGKNVPPKYTGVKVSRKPSPIFDNDAQVEKTLEYIATHPVPQALVYHDYATVNAAFEGKPKQRPAEETKPDRTAAPAAAVGKKTAAEAAEAEESDQGTEAELPTWAEVHAMDEDTTTAFAEEAEADFGDVEFNDLAAFQDWLCAELGIAKPKLSVVKPSIGGKSKPSIGKAKAAAAPAPAEEEEDDATPTSNWRAKLDKFKTGK